MSKDIGTYRVRVEFYDGTGYISKWETGARYMNERDGCCPLSALRIPPSFTNEADLIGAVLWNYRNGNWSCDCNRAINYAQANDLPEPEDYTCRGTHPKYTIRRLTIINPEGVAIYNNEAFEEAPHE